jgi:hypothetical protein
MNHGKTHGKMVRHLMKHINIREEKTCMKFDVTHGKKRWKKRWKKLEKTCLGYLKMMKQVKTNIGK